LLALVRRPVGSGEADLARPRLVRFLSEGPGSGVVDFALPRLVGFSVSAKKKIMKLYIISTVTVPCSFTHQNY
jgi:hypothetical protein